MPTYRSRRRSYGRSRRYKRKRYVRRPMTVSRVKRIMAQELKVSVIGNDFIDVTIASPAIVPITGPIAQGDLNTQRTGNWIAPVNIHGYITVKGSDAAVVDSFGVRATILRWNNDEANDPISIVKVQEDTAAPAGPFRFINKGAFKVLWTRYITVINDIANPKFVTTRKFYIRLSGAPKVLYNINQSRKFHYFLLVTSDDLAAAGNNNPEFQIDSTFRFTDS